MPTALLPDAVGNQNVPMQVELEVGRETLGYADGGDSKSVTIAAASVLAKVARDRHMVLLDQQFPGYGLAGHKGYPTAAHQAALRELGPTPEHRRSFRGVG